MLSLFAREPNNDNIEYLQLTSKLLQRNCCLLASIFQIYNEYFVNTYGGSRILPKDSMFATVTFLHPKARGNVTVDQNGKTLIDLQYLSNKFDMDGLVLGHAKLVRILYTVSEQRVLLG